MPLRPCRIVLVAVASTLLASGCFRAPSPGPAPATPAAPTPTPEPTPEPYSAERFLPIHPRSLDARIPVLMFHDVVKERGRGSVYFDCTVAELNEMLDWLTEQGATFISLDQLHRHLVLGERVPDGAVVLTFDDNYQGFHDNALPILTERRIPSAMFVHTNFVGNKSGPHPKMDWDTLRQLDTGGLVTIASHTQSHPEDMAKLPLEDQERELQESKAILERELGHPVPFFAYPVGSGDAATFAAAQRAGYTMAFTMHNGPAEESPSIMTVNRYIHSRYKKAWEEARDAARNAPAAIFEQGIAPQPARLESGTFDDIRLIMVRGGLPKSVRDPAGARRSVGEYVQDHKGVAGMNGTFFVNAALRGTDNAMIGPFRARNEPQFYSDPDPNRLLKLANRPLVAWGPSRIAIAPFHASALNDESGVLKLLPEMTDCFLGGAWIVHDGVARTRSEMEPYAARDFNDPRKRAFFGVSDTGEIVMGASRDVITTVMLARGVAAAGIREAVLMDSGFSTSIVFDGKILATGHTARDLPSRPVPHALVMDGPVAPIADPETRKRFDGADPAVGKVSAAEAQAALSSDGSRSRRRRRR